MKLSDWIDAAAACALLGVKPPTLYAYVSRRLVRAEADAGDARRSLYARADVEALARRSRRPRARAEVAEQAIRWGDPVLVTAISEVRDGMLRLRDRPVADCAEAMTLEEVAALLCGVESVECPPVAAEEAEYGPMGRALRYLSGAVETAAPMQGQTAAGIARDGGVLMSGVANALLGQKRTRPLHLRLAEAWGLDVRGQDDLRRALVVLADHELNPSTFAVRVCASTGSSLPAALLAGMSTLTGLRHGGVAGLARSALRAAHAGRMEAFLATPAGRSPYGFGFGHPLYPEGDPRARVVLERLPQDSPSMIAQRRISERLDIAPNIDAALAALSEFYGLPDEAAFTIFAMGRLAGWIAHAIEQVQSGEIIRPRARYRGAQGCE